MWKLQDLESAVIWSEKERCSSKMKPRLHGHLGALCMVVFSTLMAKIKCAKVRALLEKHKVRSGAFKSAFTINLKLLWCRLFIRLENENS